MNKPNIDWDQLRLVLFVARAGNFTKAARLLGVNQTTIGRNLNTLERELGVPLFYRSRTAIVPTEYGESVIAEAEVMESAALSAVDRIGRVKTEPQGVVRFQIMSWLFNRVVAPHISAFSAQYPGIELQAIVDQRLRFMDKGETQIALRFDMPPRGRAHHLPLVVIPYSVYAAANKEHDQLNWLGFREDQFESKAEKWMKPKGEQGKVIFWANDTEMLYSAAHHGLGKVLLPEYLGNSDPNLIRVPGSESVMRRTLHVQYLPEMLRLKRVEIFLEWLSEILTQAFKNQAL